VLVGTETKKGYDEIVEKILRRLKENVRGHSMETLTIPDD